MAYNNNKGSSNKSGLKEILLFVGFICLIFAFLVSGEITSPDLFLKILNIILLVVLTGIGVISSIKSLVSSVSSHSKAMIILNSALLLIYATLIIKVIYTV